MPALQGVAKGNMVWVNMHAGTMGAGLQGTCGGTSGCVHLCGHAPDCPVPKGQGAECQM